MKKNSMKAIIALFFFSGFIGLATYFVNSTQIEGSTPETNATSSEENKDAKVTTTSTSPTDEAVVESTPAEQQPPASVAPESAEQLPQTEVHTVQEGQNLWEIAQNAEMSLQDLMNANQLSSSAIFAGQELLVNK